tara:strand:- start:39 stop:971 length:933 start_codon:yes stop_codon:yes gene_type:complete
MAVNDNIRNALESYGGFSINTRVYNYLGSLGYTGTISDRLAKYSYEDKKGWQALIARYAGGLSELLQLQQLLFGNGEQGLLFVPEPGLEGEDVLYQDAAGTTLADANGDPVGRGDEFSGNNNSLTQSVSADRPLYQTDGSLHWVEGDGAGDHLVVPWVQDASSSQSMSFAVEQVESNQFRYVFGANSDEGVNAIVNSGVLRAFVTTTAGGGIALEGSTISSGQPFIYTVTWDRSSGDLRIYLNGVLDASKTTPVADLVPASNHALLNRGPSGSQHYKAKVYGGAASNWLWDEATRESVEAYLAKLVGRTL